MIDGLATRICEFCKEPFQMHGHKFFRLEYQETSGWVTAFLCKPLCLARFIMNRFLFEFKIVRKIPLKKGRHD